MLVLTTHWLSWNPDGPPGPEFAGGLLICHTGDDGTKDYAGVVLDDAGQPARYFAIDGDLNEEGWAPVAQRALKHPGFTAIPDNWVELLAKLVGEAQDAGCLDGPRASGDGANVRYLRPVEPPRLDS